MSRRPSFLDRDEDDLRGYLVRHARADGAHPTAANRVLGRVVAAHAGAAVGLGTASAAASAGVPSSVVTWAIAFKWLMVGVTAGAVSIGAGQVATKPIATP